MRAILLFRKKLFVMMEILRTAKDRFSLRSKHFILYFR